jgi:hypothetical protein
MNQDWKVRIQHSDHTPYQFKATMLLKGAAEPGALEVSYLYGDGDLAVFLEDLGAAVPAICILIEQLRGRRMAEIRLDVTEEAMEVLSRRPEAGA